VNVAYENPTRRVLTEGALSQLSGELKRLGGNHVLLFTGQRWLRNSAHMPALKKQLAGYSITRRFQCRAIPECRILKSKSIGFAGVLNLSS